MKIESALRYKIFSHLPGTECFLPGSSLVCRVFPARLEVWGQDCLAQISFTVAGILRQFTVTADLEEFAIYVSGFSDTGYFRYQVAALDGGFVLKVLKSPIDVTIDILETKYQIEKRVNSYFFYTRSQQLLTAPHRERLSLGCSKAQDVEMIFRRQDIREIVPLWFYYAQSVASEAEPIHIMQHTLQDMTLIGFKGIFVPRIQDELHYGVEYPWMHSYEDPAAALKSSFSYLRQIFFKEQDAEFSFLQDLLPQFHCGRFIGVKTKAGHLISFEWTKKKMRRLIIRPSQDDAVTCHFPSDIESFRAQSSGFKSILKNGAQFFLKKDTPLLLDNFQK